MKLVNLIIGILLVLFAIGSVIGCIRRTPENLRRWYGLMFVICALAGLVGGILLIVGAFVG